jgi:hypothetical protein
MDVLCAYHAKSADICLWVIANCKHITDNETVVSWVKASEEHLKSLNDGPVMVSIR